MLPAAIIKLMRCRQLVLSPCKLAAGISLGIGTNKSEQHNTVKVEASSDNIAGCRGGCRLRHLICQSASLWIAMPPPDLKPRCNVPHSRMTCENVGRQAAKDQLTLLSTPKPSRLMAPSLRSGNGGLNLIVFLFRTPKDAVTTTASPTSMRGLLRCINVPKYMQGTHCCATSALLAQLQ